MGFGGIYAMNGMNAFFTAAASAAAPRWFVANEDKDHFFKCDSAMMDENGQWRGMRLIEHGADFRIHYGYGKRYIGSGCKGWNA